MKATIDIDDALYRRLKVAAAQRGRTVREIVADGVRYMLDTPPELSEPKADATETPWFGMLRRYAGNAPDGDHSMTAVRQSILRGRRKSRDR